MSWNRSDSDVKFQRALSNMIIGWSGKFNNRKITSVVLERFVSLDWASAIFVGRRYEFTILIEGCPDGVSMLAERVGHDLINHAFNLTGEVVADIVLTDSAIVWVGKGVRKDRLLFEALGVSD